VAEPERVTAQTRSFALSTSGIAAIDDWIASVCRQWGCDERAVFACRLCVAELAGNIFEHGVATAGADGAAGEERISVALTRQDDGIGIEVLDTRAPFDPLLVAPAARPASIEAAAVGGRGLMLVRAYAHSFAYRHDGTHNRVMLTIKAPQPAPA